MNYRIIGVLAAGLLTANLAGAQQANDPPGKPALPVNRNSASKVPRASDGHPDLSGGWTYAIDVAPVALKKVVDGKVTTTLVEQSARHKVFENVPGSLPWTNAPSYKPEFREKVKDLAAHESKVDGVFYCGRPGVPRIGSPRRIIQLPGEFVFLYEEISGNTFRVVPTDGRKHRADANPSYYGDAIGRWEGDTLVVETTNFTDRVGVGLSGGGTPNSAAMRLVERFTRVSNDQIRYEATVDDPRTWTAPWIVAFPLTRTPSYGMFEYACHEGNHGLVNALSASRAEERR
jgi:hypothetical protein